MQLIYDKPDAEFSIIPHLSIDGNNAIDVGGVFNDKIGLLFNELLASDIFYTDNNGNQKFVKFNGSMAFNQREKKYIVFGKILYWYVIIHRCIPYPTTLDPAIVAYGIYGDEIPISCLESESAFKSLIETIQGFSNDPPSQHYIENLLTPWVEFLEIDLEYAVQSITRGADGAKGFARELLLNYVVHGKERAFLPFHRGFTGSDSERTFTSVCFSTMSLLIKVFAGNRLRFISCLFHIC